MENEKTEVVDIEQLIDELPTEEIENETDSEFDDLNSEYLQFHTDDPDLLRMMNED